MRVLFAIIGPMSFNEKNVNGNSEDGADVRADDRHPEPIIGQSEDVFAPSGHPSQNSRRQVTCRVDGVAAVGAETRADGDDGQTDVKRSLRRRHVAVLLVGDGAHAQQQQERAQYLRNFIQLS